MQEKPLAQQIAEKKGITNRMGIFPLWRLLRRNKRRVPVSHKQPSPPAETYFDEERRRHRADAPYLLPKDDQEIQRLNYQHFILRQVLRGNTFAPVHRLLTKGGNVLDVGCGTGRWGHEIAQLYPQARVIGVDLEDIPRSVSTPLNYQFQRGNLLHGLPFAAQQFHYVHQRLLVAGIPQEQWPWVIEELKRVTAPEGWLELVEMGNAFHHAGPATQQFLAWWGAICRSRNIDATVVSHLDLLLKQAGFVEIKTRTETLPVGSWGGRLGNLLAQDMLAGWPSMRPLAHTLLGVPPHVFDAVIACLEAEWNTHHTSYDVYFACGQVASVPLSHASE